MDDYRAINRANWDERAPLHAASAEYGLARFADDPEFISDVVRFDLPRLGDVAGLRGIHLQCHIGTDTISLSRLGASMTGLDFSPVALAEARRLAESAGADVPLVEGDVYDAPALLGRESFDLVFTGVGAIGWLPDIRRWAAVVAALLRPGGRLFIREGHPMLWALDDVRTDGLLAVEYPYFERPEPLVWTDESTYVTVDKPLVNSTTHEWNHGLGEIISALLGEGLVLTGLTEHDSLPWQPFPGQMTDIGGGEWRLTDRPWRLPHSYTLTAVKPNPRRWAPR